MSLDTRDKILSLSHASEMARELHRKRTSVVAFVSHLDVLRAVHVRKLEAVCKASDHVFVILTDSPSPLVPLDARAEVAAGLRCVSYVVPAPNGAAEVLAALSPTTCIYDEEEDRERTRELIAHVRSRAGK